MDRPRSRDAGDRPLLDPSNVDQQESRRGARARQLISQLPRRDEGHRAPRGGWDRAARHTTEVLVVHEFSDRRRLTAHGAARVLAHGEGVPALAERVVHHQPADQRIPDADDELHGLGRLDGSDGRAEDPEHPSLGAGWHQTRRRRLGEHAAVAGAVLGPPDAGLTVEAIDRPPDVGLAEQHARVVEQISGREVVGPVQDEVVVGNDRKGVGRVDPDVMPDDSHQWVDRCQRLRCGLGLGPPDVLDPVDHLPLQVRHLHDVGVNHTNGSDAGSREVQQRRRPQTPRSDDQHPRVLETALTLHAHVRDEHVPGVALDLLHGQRRRWLDKGWECHAGEVTPA